MHAAGNFYSQFVDILTYFTLFLESYLQMECTCKRCIVLDTKKNKQTTTTVSRVFVSFQCFPMFHHWQVECFAQIHTQQQ